MAGIVKRDTRKLSLYPLDVETALSAALQVEPPPKAPRKGRVKKEKPPTKDGQGKKA
jgi:hypothetical protein